MQIAPKVQILSPKCDKYLPNERFQPRDANSKETVAGQKTNTSKRKSALIKKPPPPLFTCHQNWEVWNESGKRGSVDPQELERRC